MSGSPWGRELGCGEGSTTGLMAVQRGELAELSYPLKKGARANLSDSVAADTFGAGDDLVDVELDGVLVRLGEGKSNVELFEARGGKCVLAWFRRPLDRWCELEVALRGCLFMKT